MGSNTLAMLGEATTLAQRMVAAAREGRWEEVHALEAMHRALIDAAFSDAVPVDQAPSVSDAIRDLLGLTQELGRLCTRGRDEVGAALGKIGLGRKMQRVYGSTPR